MILSRPIKSGSEGTIQFSKISGFGDFYPSDPYSSVSSQGSQGLHHNKAYQDSTSPEEYDTDMGGTVAGSSPTSPENDINDDGIKGHGNDVLQNKTMAAIPEYFASKKTKDGKIPKKRGPKPDSKPARDRRQELNRQAQRNHRHRKEEQQKWLEEALADAHEKARTAMRRAQEAERRHQHISRIYEQSQCENDRLKQLLDVNRIPFARVIPQAPPLGIDLPPTVQQNSAFASTTSTTPITTSTTPSSKVSPQSSSSADTALNDLRFRSSMSPVPSMDGSEEYEEQSSSPQMHEYVQSSNSHQPNLEMNSISHPTNGHSSGLATGQASAAAAMAADYGAQLGGTPFHQIGNPDPSYPVSSVGSNQSSSPTLVSGPIGTHHSDPYAIKDHDQTGVDFILALEANCHDHKTFMNSRTINDPEQLGGHSLMLSKVPVEVAKNYRPGDPPHPHGPPDVGEGPGKYARLLSLVNLKPFSTNKNWELRTGEISPAQALGFIRKDPRYAMLNSNDFLEIIDILKDKCRCYGFGAVVEVYEVHDVLNDTFAKKGFGIDDGYSLDHPLWKKIPLSNPHTLDGPEYPSLDRLMEFDLAGLMSTRHADREQFLAADLNTYNVPSSVGGASSNHQCGPDEGSFDNSQPSQLPEFPQCPIFTDMQPANVNQQVQQGQINPGYSNNQHSLPHDYPIFDSSGR